MLVLIIIATLVSIGFQFAIEPDNILQEYKRLLKRLMKIKLRSFRLGYWFAKPLGYCITCHSHWVGFILFSFNSNAFTTFTTSTVGKWVTIELCSIAVAGLSTFIWFIYEYIRTKFELLNR